MDAERALDILRNELKRTSQARIAERMGVSDATISRWLSGKASPEGRRLELLVDWASTIPQQAPPDAITAAILATGENVKRLAEIRGYAQFVLDQLLDLAGRQKQVVEALNPWAEAEGRQIALNMEKAAAAEAALRRAVPPIGAPAAPAAQKAKKKASGGK